MQRILKYYISLQFFLGVMLILYIMVQTDGPSDEHMVHLTRGLLADGGQLK